MRRIVCFIILILVAVTVTKGQFNIQNLDEWNRVKGDTTFILLDDITSQMDTPYVNVFKQYWKVTPIKFIQTDQLTKHLSKNATYLSFIVTNEIVQPVHNGIGMGSPIIRPGSSIMDFRLWTCKEKYFNKERKWDWAYTNEIATMELFVSSLSAGSYTSQASGTFQTFGGPKICGGGDYLTVDQGGYIYNWGPGILKNYVQILSELLTAGNERKFTQEITDNAEIKRLKTDTLYIPKFVAYKIVKFGAVTTEKTDLSKLVSNYKLPYSIITTQQLNDKILNKKGDIYYFMYMHSNRAKYIAVINGFTGEIVYSDYSKSTDDVTDGDFKDLRSNIIK